jgi:hypothetical protein
MMLFRKKSHPVTLIVQVMSDRVAFAVADLSPESPTILLAETATLPSAERTLEQTSQQLATLVSERTASFLEQYGKSEHSRECGPVTAAELHIGAAYTEADTAMHKITFPKATVIAQSHIEAAAKDAIATLPKSDRAMLESHVIRVHVSGYPTANPVGKTGKSMCVTVFRSTIDAAFRDRLTEAVHRGFPGPIALRSFARDLMTVLREHSQSRQHLVISVEGAASHCVSLRGDEIAAHATVALGSGEIMTRLTGTGSAEETRTLIRLASRDACSTTACEAIRAKLASAEPIVVQAFGDEFAALSRVYRLPNACLVLADPDIAPWLEHVFARIDFAQFTVTSQPLSVSPFESAVRGLVKGETAHVDPSLTTAIAASALYTKSS